MVRTTPFLVMEDLIHLVNQQNIVLIRASLLQQQKIIATSTIQVSKGKGSAPLELQGFKNCLAELEEDGYKVNTVATDRNRQLAKWLRVERNDISHKFVPWHFAKNIKSKLRPLGIRKGCKILQEWIKPVGNHLF